MNSTHEFKARPGNACETNHILATLTGSIDASAISRDRSTGIELLRSFYDDRVANVKQGRRLHAAAGSAA